MTSAAYSVDVVPMFQDNYLFSLRFGNEVILIDPGDFIAVREYLERENIRPMAILNTHHHPDHVGGNKELYKIYGCPIYGNAKDKARLPGVTDFFTPGDQLQVGPLNVEVIDVSGHTIGHCAFYDAFAKKLFVGDSLFSLGCGRMFEGNPEMMLGALQRLTQLPASTLVYAAHEYTLANGAFSLTVDSKNTILQDYVKRCRELREIDIPTVPFNLGLQLSCNPFLRTADETIQAHFQTQNDEVATFAAMRTAKDNF